VSISLTFHQHSTSSFCASRFTPNLLAYGAESTAQKLGGFSSSMEEELGADLLVKLNGAKE